MAARRARKSSKPVGSADFVPVGPKVVLRETSLDFSWSASFISLKTSAPVLQLSTQAGIRPCPSLSIQLSHLSATCFGAPAPPGSTSKRITPKGQAMAQDAQRMQRLASILTVPVAPSRSIAPEKQAIRQGAGSQWRHRLGKGSPWAPVAKCMRGGESTSSFKAPSSVLERE